MQHQSPNSPKIGGTAMETIATEHGTPVYVYDAAVITQ